MSEPINDEITGSSNGFFNASNSEPSFQPDSIEGLFLRALQLETGVEREAFLASHCGDNLELRKKVRILLKAYEDAGSFLETPVLGHRPSSDWSLGFLKPSQREGLLGTIGQYDVIEVIGRGGMGIVLKATDVKLNRIVAVKVLLPELAFNPNSRRRFLREAQAAAAISHPHVVTIYSVQDAQLDPDGRNVPPFIVMECVVGQSLQQKLDRVGTLGLEEILRISRQIADGLSEAHTQGLIHRDIKPSNILLENGVERVKLTDFGLARAIDDITVTQTGEVAGTPSYMSPEQANGERVDSRSDLFSLGCVMYAMCTGHSPFRGESVAHVIKRVTQETPRPIELQNPTLPGWLIQIVNCLLQKNPSNRIQSANELVDTLDKHLKELHQPIDSKVHLTINRQLPTADSSKPTTSTANVKLRTQRETWALRFLFASVLMALLGFVTGVFGLFAIFGSTTAITPEVPLPGPPTWPLSSLVMFAISIFFGLIGAISFGTKSKSEFKVPLLFLYLLLGPLGIVLWLMDRDRRDSQSTDNTL